MQFVEISAVRCGPRYRVGLPKVATAALLAILALPLMVLASCGEDDGDGGNSEHVPLTDAVRFHAEPVIRGEEILSLGGLVLRGDCRQINGDPLLMVAARTEIDNAIIGSEYSFASHTGEPVPHAFTKTTQDFDTDGRAFNVFEPTAPSIAGTLTYATPESGTVTLTWLGDWKTAQGGCAFVGIAQYVP